MAACTLRPFNETDPDWLLEWYRADRKGLEDFMGMELPNETQYMHVLQAMLDTVLQGAAMFWMLEREDHPLGFFLMTDFTEANRCARIHIYMDPEQRRYSIQAAKAIDTALTLQMKKRGLQQVIASMGTANKGAHALAKRMGFHTLPQVILAKEI